MDPLADTLADDGSPAHRLAVGQRVFGRYALVAPVGRGAMGVVWRARDEALGEEVALKFIPDLVRWDAAGCAELKAETRRTRALTHPNIVRVHDWVEDAERAAIAMEFVEGQSLAEVRLTRPGQIFEPADILPWLAPLCAALDYAHREARLVHRDLKPANLLLARDGTIKLADFGIARGLAEAITRASQTAASGTLLYMSPQQALGEPPAPSDDIYALGATLYELLTGRPPFYTGHVQAQLHGRRPESLAARRRALGVSGERLPAAWEQTVAACLAKRPERRPASAGEAARRLCGAESSPDVRWSLGTRWATALGVALGLVGAVAWWASRSAPMSAPAATEALPSEATPLRPVGSSQPLTEYAEDFSSGLGGWAKWGEPMPQTLATFQGRRDAFDNNGDGMHTSGITSLAVLSAPDGFSLETEVYINVTNPAGCHLAANVGLTASPNRWMDALGTRGDDAEGIKLGIDFAGDACWGADVSNRRHAWFLGQFRAEDETMQRLDGHTLQNSANADEFVNRWVTLRIEVAADRTVRFWCERKLIWAPEKKLHPGILSGQRLVVSGRSLGSAGKAYHDAVRFRPLGSGGSVQKYAPPPGAAADQTLLPWQAEAWEAVRAPEMTRWLATSRPAGEPLRLTAGVEQRVTLRSRRQFSEEATLNFSVQALLQSDVAGGDVGRVGWVSAEGPEPRRFVGLEFHGGEVWFIDTLDSGPAQRVHRMGTYAPGAWLDYTLFHDGANGTIEAVGSLAYVFSYKLPRPQVLRWQIEAGVESSADGLLLRPVRVISGRVRD